MPPETLNFLKSCKKIKAKYLHHFLQDLLPSFCLTASINQKHRVLQNLIEEHLQFFYSMLGQICI